MEILRWVLVNVPAPFWARVAIRLKEFFKNRLQLIYFVIQSMLQMDLRSKAEEDLRVIRNLMERATIYRAISAPSALVAGALSILVTVAVYWNNEHTSIFGRVIRGRQFVNMWIAVLVVSLAANTFF